MHSDSAQFSQTIIHSAICKGLNEKLPDPSINYVLQAISKIADHAQEQGKSRCKSAAYTEVCEHFEEAFNAVIEC